MEINVNENWMGEMLQSPGEGNPHLVLPLKFN